MQGQEGGRWEYRLPAARWLKLVGGEAAAGDLPACLIAAPQPPACTLPLLLCSWNGCSNQDFALSTNGTLDVLQYLACEWLRRPRRQSLFEQAC